MASSVPHLYAPSHLQQQPQPMQYQPPPYSNPYPTSAATLYANSLINAYGQLPSTAPALPPTPFVYDQPSIGTKRASDDVLQAVDLLSKRPRPDSGGTLGFYPQRPGEKVCAYYMTTRTCSFGHTCKFDHPVWVPFGGIPNWKEVTGAANASTEPSPLPQRTGEQNCPFYMKTGDCKYGLRCKFNHPKDRHTALSDPISQAKDEASPDPLDGETTGSDLETATTAALTGSAPALKVPQVAEKGPSKAASLNSKGLPIRQNETECTFYIKTGSCKYGAACRFNHPEGVRPGPRPVPPTVAVQTAVPVLPYTASDFGSVSSRPQRPGGQDCTYYLKTGECSFGPSCKFHHPANRQPSSFKAAPKLTLAGLPRREGEVVCAYYMKTGACKYGPTCRFDHPPPGEVAAKAAAEASRTETPPVLDAFDVHLSQGAPFRTTDWPWVPELQQSGPYLNGALHGYKAPS